MWNVKNLRTGALALTILMLISCAPTPHHSGDSSGGASTGTDGASHENDFNEQGLEYTPFATGAADFVSEEKNEIPNTPENIALAKTSDIDIHFMSAQNKEVEDLDHADHLAITVYVQNPLLTLQYTVPASQLKASKGQAIPLNVVGTASAFSATIECKSADCSMLFVHLFEGGTPPALSSTPSPTPTAPGNGSHIPMPGHKPAPPVKGSRKAISATLVNLSDAQVEILIPPAVSELITAETLAQYPELDYLKRNYLTPKMLHAISKETVHGATRTTLKIPILNEFVFITNMELVETNDKPSHVTPSCGAEYFPDVELSGNSHEGWLALTLLHRSGLKLVMDVNLDPRRGQVEASHPDAPEKQPPMVQVSDAELDHIVNSHAFIKVDLSGQRTRMMEHLLQSERLTPKQAALLDKRLNMWLTGGYRTILASFFGSKLPLNSLTEATYSGLDIPKDLMMLTLKESGKFWTDGTIQSGLVTYLPEHKMYDCPVGPSQMLYMTAVEIANKVLHLNNYKLVKPGIGKNHVCPDGRVFARANDDRADFPKASRLTAGYMSLLASYFDGAHGTAIPVVDPRILLAAYNRGQGGMQNAIFQVVASDSKDKHSVGSAGDARHIYNDGGFQRLFTLSQVYPDFWRLRKLRTFPQETDEYVLDWMLFRRINQSPQDYGFQMAKPQVGSAGT